LFFDYLNLVDRLKPKVSIAENVKGMIQGAAKGYVKMIFQRYKEIGYRPQLFLVNAADCGVPQKRERVFFVALRNDIEKAPLVLKPQHRWISAGEATDDVQVLTEDEIRDTLPSLTDKNFWQSTKQGSNYTEACQKQRGKSSFFNHVRLSSCEPSPTLTSGLTP
jgi:DNA (cytosine-5)-methyltransferase 1